MDRPNPQRHVQPLRPGSGQLPWTEGFESARDGWVAGWRREQSAFVSAIRAEQAKVGGDSARFGVNQLQGHGSTKNLGYVAKRWEGLAGQYVVGAGEHRKTVSQGAGDGSYSISGLDGWLKKLDAEVRMRVLRDMDRAVAPWFYRAAFHDETDVTITIPKKTVWVMPDGTVGFGPGAHKEIRKVTETRHYSGCPVWSGFSRSQLSIEWIASPSELKVLVRSPAPYTLAASATRVWWGATRRKLRTLIQDLGQRLRADLGALNG